MKQRYDQHKKGTLQYKVGDHIFALKPHLPPGNTILKLAKLYDGPYRIETFLPGFRTMRVIRMKSRNNPGGEVRLVHVDNAKPFHPAPALREDTIYEVAPPAISTAAENKVIDQLERATSTAKATIGAPRSRAIISHTLQQDHIQPLPDPLLRHDGITLPHPNVARETIGELQDNSLPIVTYDTIPPGHIQTPGSPPPPLEQTPQDMVILHEKANDSKDHGHEPPQPPPRPPPIEFQLATSWKDDRPWHLPSSSSHSIPTGYSRSGRALKPSHHRDPDTYIHAMEISNPSSPAPWDLPSNSFSDAI